MYERCKTSLVGVGGVVDHDGGGGDVNSGFSVLVSRLARVTVGCFGIARETCLYAALHQPGVQLGSYQ